MRQAEIIARAQHWLRTAYPKHTAKMMQREIGVSSDVAEKAMQGRISQQTMGKLIGHFGGDFLRFVFAEHLGAPAMRPEAFYWIAPEGIDEAPVALARFLKHYPHLILDDEDFRHHALNNLGWIWLRKTSDSYELTYGESVDHEAVVLARESITGALPKRVVINGAEHVSVQSAIQALQALEGHVLAHEAMLAANWVVDRQPLEAVAAKPLIKVLQSWHQQDGSSAALVRALSHANGMRSAASLLVEGENVTSLHAGDLLGVCPSVMGKNVMDRPGNKKYPSLVRKRAIECAKLRVPTFYRLHVEIDDRPEKYLSLMMAAPIGDNRFVVGSAVERLAA